MGVIHLYGIKIQSYPHFLSLRYHLCLLHKFENKYIPQALRNGFVLLPMHASEHGILLPSSSSRWKMNDVQQQWTWRESRKLPQGVCVPSRCWTEEKEREFPTISSNHFSAVILYLAQDERSLESVSLSLQPLLDT